MELGYTSKYPKKGFFNCKGPAKKRAQRFQLSDRRVSKITGEAARTPRLISSHDDTNYTPNYITDNTRNDQ